MAPGHEGVIPERNVLEESCNLGYAASCARLPQAREWDAVRFAVTALGKAGSISNEVDEKDLQAKRVIQLNYVCERAHRPVEYGKLEFDVIESRWLRSHANPRIQKMAECFLESYLAKRKSREVDGTVSFAEALLSEERGL